MRNAIRKKSINAHRNKPDQGADGSADRKEDAALDGLEQRIPALARCAEEAVRLYVEQGHSIRTDGDPGVRSEALGRSGGIMEMNFSRPSPITLYFPTSVQVFCNSFDDAWPIGDLAAKLRADGVILAWSFSGCKTDPGRGAQAIGNEELFIDQRWDFGDAVVAVPGYDIKILPTSGVITESVLRLVEAEIVRLSAGRTAAEIRLAAGARDLAPAITPEWAECWGGPP